MINLRRLQHLGPSPSSSVHSLIYQKLPHVLCGPKPSSLFFTSNPTIGGLITVRELRVGSYEIPDKKRLEFSLQYIPGIGRSRARQLLSHLSLGNKVTKDLSQLEYLRLRDEVSKDGIGDDPRVSSEKATKRLMSIQCYRGIRLSEGLPCRGQRTKTNARTSRHVRAKDKIREYEVAAAAATKKRKGKNKTGRAPVLYGQNGFSFPDKIRLF